MQLKETKTETLRCVLSKIKYTLPSFQRLENLGKGTFIDTVHQIKVPCFTISFSSGCDSLGTGIVLGLIVRTFRDALLSELGKRIYWFRVGLTNMKGTYSMSVGTPKNEKYNSIGIQ